jgi:hypothetical protein
MEIQTPRTDPTDSEEDELLQKAGGRRHQGKSGARGYEERRQVIQGNKELKHAGYKYDSVTIVYGPPILSSIPRAPLNLSVALHSLRNLAPSPPPLYLSTLK